MENFNFKSRVEGLSSKMVALLSMITVMGLSEPAFSQEKPVNMEELKSLAKKYEISISDNVAKNGEKSIINYAPAATLNDGTSIVQVIYTNDQRTDASSFLIYKDGKCFYDKEADGKIDGVYVDKKDNAKEIPTSDELLKTRLTIVSGGPTQTELDLVDMMPDGGDKFVYFNIEGKDYIVFDTSDKSISKIPEENKIQVDENLQQKFIKVLESNPNSK
jgi:hypothetical protein